MTLEADRGPSTRGAMLDPSLQQDPRLQLEIGICGNTRPDGTEVLEVNLKCNPTNDSLVLLWLNKIFQLEQVASHLRLSG